MRKLLILGSLTFCLAVFAVSTFTTNYNLEKPGAGDLNYATALNSNFDTIDSQLDINATSTNDHLADTVGAHAATAISTTVGTICTSQITVQAFLLCLDEQVDLATGGGSVSISTAQTITGQKTFSQAILAEGGISAAGVIEMTTTNVTGELSIDNLLLNGNAITSVNSAGDITITPDTTGDLVLDGINWPQADGEAHAVLATDGSAQSNFQIHYDQSFLGNVSINASVDSDDLTVALKQADGSTDCSATAPCKIAFRSTTATNPAIVVREVTADLEVTVPDGGTLGHSSSVADYVYVYVIDNDGTVELAVSSSRHWDQSVLQSSTTVSDAADSAVVLYSTTGRTSKPVRYVGRFLSSQSTAGTWASAPSQESAALTQHIAVPRRPTRQVFTSGSGTYTTPAGVTYLKVIMVGAGGGGGGSGSTNGTAATAGGDSTFGTSLLTAGGGALGPRSTNGAAGGSATINSPAFGRAIAGSRAEGGITGVSALSAPGGKGGASCLGAGNGAGSETGANAVAANTGNGGSGGGTQGAITGGSGGGAGGCVVAFITNPAASYGYAVGAAGAAGGAGTSGSAGGAGSAGIVIVEEY